MTVRELYAFLEEKMPRALSCDWDNDGLMVCPDDTREVRRVLVALDITAAVAEQAIKEGYDLVVSHHPLIFHPLKAVAPGEATVNKVIRLLTSGVSAMSFHTRLDAVGGGVNDVLANAIGLQNVVPFGKDGEEIGRIGTLPETMSLPDFAEYVKRALGVPFVCVADASRSVRRVAVVGGEGKDFISIAREAGADTYLSGRLGYHNMQDSDINLIEAGHYFTERPALWALMETVNALDPTLTSEIYTPNPISIY